MLAFLSLLCVCVSIHSSALSKPWAFSSEVTQTQHKVLTERRHNDRSTVQYVQSAISDLQGENREGPKQRKLAGRDPHHESTGCAPQGFQEWQDPQSSHHCLFPPLLMKSEYAIQFDCGKVCAYIYIIYTYVYIYTHIYVYPSLKLFLQFYFFAKTYFLSIQ